MPNSLSVLIGLTWRPLTEKLPTSSCVKTIAAPPHVFRRRNNQHNTKKNLHRRDWQDPRKHASGKRAQDGSESHWCSDSPHGLLVGQRVESPVAPQAARYGHNGNHQCRGSSGAYIGTVDEEQRWNEQFAAGDAQNRGTLDILLANSIEGEARDGPSVWQELGLFVKNTRRCLPATLSPNVKASPRAWTHLIWDCRQVR